MTLRARFVDSISATPTVRLDLTASPWRILKSSRFDPPAIKRARVSTLLTDGAQYPASAYDDRVLELHLHLEDATSDDAATAVQELARELDRHGTNFFEYRLPNQTNSVFFRTFRLALESVDIITDGTLQRIIAPVIAEPFGYGLREDPVVDAVVSADPAAVSNGCFVDVSGVKGDVETPALIKWPSSATATDRQTLLATRRRGTPSQAPFEFQAENADLANGTVVQANDTAFSGAGSNYVRTTFSTSSMLFRVRFSDLGTSSVDLRGTYRVFVRYRKNTAADVINLQAQWGDLVNTNVENDIFSTPDTIDICMADLGLISVPFGLDPVYDFATGVELPVDDAFRLSIYAQQTSGSGTLDIDCALLVPADDRLSIVAWPTPTAVEDHWLLDAQANHAHARNASDEVVAVKAPSVTGGFPLLTPNQTNRIYALYEVAEGQAHAIATNTTVSVSYLPRYLTIRPAST